MALADTPLKMLRFRDSPEAGYTTWTTFQHSERTWRGPDVLVGYELVVAAKGPVDGMTILRRAVETLAAVNRPPVVGAAVLDLLTGIEGLPDTLRHAVFAEPWWNDEALPLHEEGRRVEAVVIVPASEGEVELLRTQGLDALERGWERTVTPLLDPGRPTLA